MGHLPVTVPLASHGSICPGEGQRGNTHSLLCLCSQYVTDQVSVSHRGPAHSVHPERGSKGQATAGGAERATEPPRSWGIQPEGGRELGGQSVDSTAALGCVLESAMYGATCDHRENEHNPFSPQLLALACVQSQQVHRELPWARSPLLLELQKHWKRSL